MGAVPSTTRCSSARPQDTANSLIASFDGEKSFPLGSDFWQKLLELPLNLRWPTDRVQKACQLFGQFSFRNLFLSSIKLFNYYRKLCVKLIAIARLLFQEDFGSFGLFHLFSEPFLIN